VLQELLHGFAKPKAHNQIINRFSATPVCGEAVPKLGRQKEQHD